MSNTSKFPKTLLWVPIIMINSVILQLGKIGGIMSELGYTSFFDIFTEQKTLLLGLALFIKLAATIFVCFLIVKRSPKFRLLSISIILAAYFISMILHTSAIWSAGTGVGAFVVSIGMSIYIWKSKKVLAYFEDFKIVSDVTPIEPTL